MEQRQDEASASADAVAGEAGSASEEGGEAVLERHFWPVLVASILLSGAAGVGVAYTQYNQLSQAASSVPYADRVVQMASALPYVDGRADTTETGRPRRYGSFTKLQGLIVNPADSDDRYLAVSIAFEANSSSVTAELKDKEVVVRDAVLDLLSERTVKELTAPDRRDELKKRLLKETNSILRNGTVRQLYFTEFVLQ